MAFYSFIIYVVVVPVVSLMIFRFFLSRANYYLNATRLRPNKHTVFYEMGKGRFFLVSFLIEEKQVGKSVIVLSITSIVSVILTCVSAIISYYCEIDYLVFFFIPLLVINLVAILFVVNYNDKAVWTALGTKRDQI